MHGFVISIFDRLAASVGPAYLDEPQKLLAALLTMLERGALPTACPVTCVPFDDVEHCRPHQVQPCGHIMATMAFQRPRSAQTCPKCAGAADGVLPPAISTVTLARAAACARLQLHRVELPPEVDSAHVTLGAYIDRDAEGVVAAATWARPGKPARTVAVKRVKMSFTPHRRLALESLARAYVACRHSRHVCPVHGYHFVQTGHGVELRTLMELCPSSLAGRVFSAPLPLAEALRICAAVADGLAELHDTLHLWHLDIKVRTRDTS